MSNLRRTLQRAMALNETHVDASRAANVTLSTDEAELLESLKSNPGFAGYPKAQLDRHTIKHLLVTISDSPVSVCERAARKAEILMASGALNENLDATNGAKSLCEAEVPEERPAAPEGDGDFPQGDADSLSGEHDGEDHENPGKEDSEADDDGTKQGGERGDQSDTADKGYKDEKKESKKRRRKVKEADDVEHGHDEDDAFKLESDDEDEDDLGEAEEPSATEPMESEDDDEDDLEEEGAEGSQNDAEDSAPEPDRAASDARYKDGVKQNESADDEDESDDEDEDDLKEDDLSRDDETKDVKDHPDYDQVQKEDPADSKLDKGPLDPKLESLKAIERRICNILSEAGVKKGSQRWTEAYLRGWNLAMEHRAQKLSR